MLDDVRESHALLAIYHKDAFEEVLQFCCLFFQLVFFGEGVRE
jgi:hypothetical protein